MEQIKLNFLKAYFRGKDGAGLHRCSRFRPKSESAPVTSQLHLYIFRIVTRCSISEIRPSGNYARRSQIMILTGLDNSE
jgi:hypothetical protein